MGAKSNIEWTDATWNPVTGCTKVSEGCRNCYAETWANRRLGEFAKDPKRKFTNIMMHHDKLDIPLRWRKPRRIFVNSMSDLFYENVPFNFIDAVFSTIVSSKQHTFQILTKRPERMMRYSKRAEDLSIMVGMPHSWPPKNVWFGVSVEDQKTFDERVPFLLKTTAAIRWISAEPLLGPINCDLLERLNWVVVGGESGHGARPMHPDWVRSIRDQCQQAHVPFFFKQWGEWSHRFPQSLSMAYRQMTFKHGETFYKVGKKNAGRILDGRTWDEFPNV